MSPALLHDFREVLAGIRRRPAIPALAVAILALGIGTNAAVFGLVDAVLFRPLPVRKPNELVRLFGASSSTGQEPGRISRPFFEDYRRAASLAGLELWSDGLPVDVAFAGRAPERLSAAVASSGFFSTLGVTTATGRLFEPRDEVASAEAAPIVLSHRLWERAFGSDPRVLGAGVRVNRHPFVVVGVTPPGFEGIGLERLPDLWLPLSEVAAAEPAWRGQIGHRSSTFFHAVGRLAKGADRRTAQAEMAVIAAALGAGAPARGGPEVEDPGWREPWPWLEPAQGVVGRGSRDAASLLLGVAVLVLALTAANVASLLLARGEGRRRERAVRISLGASRWRVARPVVLEALLLSSVAALMGLGLAHAATRAVSASTSAAAFLPVAAVGSIHDLRVLVATAIVGGLAALLASLAPALHAAGADPLSGLRGAAPARLPRRWSTRAGLVVIQLALTTILLAGVGALLGSLWAAASIAPGVDAGRIQIARLDLARGGYDAERGLALALRIEEGLRAAPDVRRSALSVGIPLQGGASTTVTIAGVPERMDFAMVTPGYFETLGVVILRGRVFERADRAGAAPVAVVNQAFVRRFLPVGDPLGRRIEGFTPRNASLAIVGVVRDVQTHGVREPVHPLMYVPLTQFYGAFPWQFGVTALLSVRDPAVRGRVALEAVVASLDPELPVLQSRSLSDELALEFAEARLLASLLGAFGVVAMVLAGAGFYGLMAFMVSSRTRELGIRAAIGAPPPRLRRMILEEALALSIWGAGLGLIGAFAAAAALRPFVFEFSPTDPRVFGVCLTCLAVMTLAAAAVPALRAAAVDPVVALRHD